MCKAYVSSKTASRHWCWTASLFRFRTSSCTCTRPPHHTFTSAEMFFVSLVFKNWLMFVLCVHCDNHINSTPLPYFLKIDSLPSIIICPPGSSAMSAPLELACMCVCDYYLLSCMHSKGWEVSHVVSVYMYVCVYTQTIFFLKIKMLTYQSISICMSEDFSQDKHRRRLLNSDKGSSSY